jgi:hypothetical protein
MSLQRNRSGLDPADPELRRFFSRDADTRELSIRHALVRSDGIFGPFTKRSLLQGFPGVRAE